MQFKGKLITQTWENGKTLFWTQLWLIWPKFVSPPPTPILLWVVGSYHPRQFNGKLMDQTWGNGKKKANFGPDLGSFWHKFGSKKNFGWVFPLLDVIHRCITAMQFQETLISQTWENDKNSSFRHDFSPFGPNSNFLFKNLTPSVTRQQG